MERDLRTKEDTSKLVQARLKGTHQDMVGMQD